jgi:hypothetical protein
LPGIPAKIEWAIDAHTLAFANDNDFDLGGSTVSINQPNGVVNDLPGRWPLLCHDGCVRS